MTMLTHRNKCILSEYYSAKITFELQIKLHKNFIVDILVYVNCIAWTKVEWRFISSISWLKMYLLCPLLHCPNCPPPLDMSPNPRISEFPKRGRVSQYLLH